MRIERRMGVRPASGEKMEGRTRGAMSTDGISGGGNEGEEGSFPIEVDRRPERYASERSWSAARLAWSCGAPALAALAAAAPACAALVLLLRRPHVTHSILLDSHPSSLSIVSDRSFHLARCLASTPVTRIRSSRRSPPRPSAMSRSLARCPSCVPPSGLRARNLPCRPWTRRR